MAAGVSGYARKVAAYAKLENIDVSFPFECVKKIALLFIDAQFTLYGRVTNARFALFLWNFYVISHFEKYEFFPIRRKYS